MALFNPKKMKIGKPIKKSFMGDDVYILPGLNALQGVQFHSEVKDLDGEAEDFTIRYAAAMVRCCVVNAKGESLFAEVSVAEMAETYDVKAISRMQKLVLEVTGDPLVVGNAEKN